MLGKLKAEAAVHLLKKEKKLHDIPACHGNPHAAEA